MIIVSACLAGINCKYNAGNNYKKEVVELVASGKAIPVCPEQLGGFTTPRLKAEIARGTGADVLESKCAVVRENGEIVTKEFIIGANEVLNIAHLVNANKAILKARSPSCGVGKIYDGTFTGGQINGNGITAELLIKNGIKVISEESL